MYDVSTFGMEIFLEFPVFVELFEWSLFSLNGGPQASTQAKLGIDVGGLS